ncbi:Probable 40S ribosomal protein S28, mitochondrial [Taphrina deformans PYCC 5710]|uniref:Probable 40S ribosomal protein S28, mitochondrial n=1 Tax=Taphrina deformans (strain PYCC 5710 / ATCC 11124 / CBS 356.35 / IMI 108563 / JCM 9778 / NBRC 8474) TaxID=1097556 RepID=R4X870_TAPDE|nr:Probable 40S ribosomal protein S28, mitochondrial [Taphrina deformans PYCC 5710]|eukprot:CCG81729.1 Probable 40S ribosomal protein S28, mitochondrial [Taphrina deformans PYCC 5710]
MLNHKRLFSTTTTALAKRRQIAIQRKKANVARQAVLKAERSPANFDPIIGVPTEFTRSLLTPTAALSSSAQAQGSLYFNKDQISSIQSAVGDALLAREQQENTLGHSVYRKPQTLDSTIKKDVLNPSATQIAHQEILQKRLEEISLANTQNSDASSRIISLQNSNARTLRAFNTAHAIREFGRCEGDTGSAEVQAAILTARILAESTHIANNKKDVHSFRGFRGLVHQRQKVLKYLRTESVERYFSCIDRLGLSDQAVVKEITM